MTLSVVDNVNQRVASKTDGDQGASHNKNERCKFSIFCGVGFFGGDY